MTLASPEFWGCQCNWDAFSPVGSPGLSSWTLTPLNGASTFLHGPFSPGALTAAEVYLHDSLSPGTPGLPLSAKPQMLSVTPSRLQNLGDLSKFTYRYKVQSWLPHSWPSREGGNRSPSQEARAHPHNPQH